MFPPAQLTEIRGLTSKRQIKRGEMPNSEREILKYFGIIIIATRFDIVSKHDLQKNTSEYDFIAAPNFGKTGMPANDSTTFSAMSGGMTSLRSAQRVCRTKSTVGV